MSYFTRTQIEDILKEVLDDNSIPNDRDTVNHGEKRVILHEVRDRLAKLEASGLFSLNKGNNNG
jgi:hypothetical protein